MQVIEEEPIGNGKPTLIRDLALRPDLSSLTDLNLSRCFISDLDGFPHMPQLEKLVLQDNKIEKGLGALGRALLTTLAHLDISKNPVWNFCEIVSLELLPGLNHFYCLDCPVMSTPYLRKMCFGYLYNLHTLNGSEGVADTEPGYDDEPMIRDMTNGPAKFIIGQKKKEFKLYNDFSHCPIISTQMWYKKKVPEVTIPVETLKRPLSQSDDVSTENGPTEKKRKENASSEFNLNQEDNTSVNSMASSNNHALDDRKEMELPHMPTRITNVNPVLSKNLSTNYIHVQSIQVQSNPNGMNHVPVTMGKNNSRGFQESDEDSEDDESYAESGESAATDESSTEEVEAIEVEGEEKQIL